MFYADSNGTNEKINLTKRYCNVFAITEEDMNNWRKRAKTGIHSRKDGWKESEELEINLDYTIIANEGRIYEK